MNSQQIESLRHYFQKAASSMGQLYKNAVNAEKHAYLQGQFDLLNELLAVQEINQLLEYIKMKKIQVQQMIERSQQQFTKQTRGFVPNDHAMVVPVRAQEGQQVMMYQEWPQQQQQQFQQERQQQQQQSSNTNQNWRTSQQWHNGGGSSNRGERMDYYDQQPQ